MKVGGKTTYHGLGPKTKAPVPRSSYQAPSKTKTSQGIAQPKSTPIQGTPKVAQVPKTQVQVPKTTTSTTTTKPKKGIGSVVKDKIQGGAQKRQSMLDALMNEI